MHRSWHTLTTIRASPPRHSHDAASSIATFGNNIWKRWGVPSQSTQLACPEHRQIQQTKDGTSREITRIVNWNTNINPHPYPSVTSWWLESARRTNQKFTNIGQIYANFGETTLEHPWTCIKIASSPKIETAFATRPDLQAVEIYIARWKGVSQRNGGKLYILFQPWTNYQHISCQVIM